MVNISVINGCFRALLEGRSLDVEVRGLEYMNDDPTRVRVLYAVARSEKCVRKFVFFRPIVLF